MFFHIGDQPFTMMGDLRTSTPDFAAHVELKEKPVNSISVFPNPAQEYILITGIPDGEEIRITLVNSSG